MKMGSWGRKEETEHKQQPYLPVCNKGSLALQLMIYGYLMPIISRFCAQTVEKLILRGRIKVSWQYNNNRKKNEGISHLLQVAALISIKPTMVFDQNGCCWHCSK